MHTPLSYKYLPETIFHHLLQERDNVLHYLGASCLPCILIFLALPETTEEVAQSVNHPLEAPLKVIQLGYRCSQSA